MSITKVKKEFYPSGAKRRLITCQDDVPQGPVTEYYESGAVKKKMEYIDGQPEGIAMEYYETGELWVEEIYKDGKLNGVVRSFYKTGALQSELAYMDGRLNGFSKVYYGSGVLKKVAKFRDGKQTGEAKIFNETGGLKRKGDFFDENDSREEYAYERGTKTDKVGGRKLFIQFLVLMGLIGLVCFIFDENSPFFRGKNKAEIHDDLRKVSGKEPSDSYMLPPKNAPDGITKTLYPSGKVYAEWSFTKGQLDGISRIYFENGKVKSETGYRKGRLDGRSVFYHENGRIVSNNIYKDGYLIKEHAVGGLQGQQEGKRIMVEQVQYNKEYDDSVFGDVEREKSDENVMDAAVEVR